MKQSQAGGPGEDRAEPGPARPPQERRALSLMLRMDRFSPHKSSLSSFMLRSRPGSGVGECVSICRSSQWIMGQST